MMTDLAVYLHDQEIGVIADLGHERSLFRFHETYLNQKTKPRLSLSLEGAERALFEEFRPRKVKLEPFFSNLLPEGALRELLAGKFHIHPQREAALIAALGRDLPGAVKIIPSSVHSPLGETLEEYEENNTHQHRFSLAGVQLKFSAHISAQKHITVPMSGSGGDWIVKFPSARYDALPQNEYAMMTLAKKIGIDVPEITMVSLDKSDYLASGPQQGFAIKRFDRSEAGAVHIEDFAQVFGVYPHRKYDGPKHTQIGKIILSEAGLEDYKAYIVRLIFNLLIGNGDMHLKNWSLIYPNKITARLAPAYDFVSTIAYIPDDKFALTFSRTKEFFNIDNHEHVHFAHKTGVNSSLVLDLARQTNTLFREIWTQEKNHLDLPSFIIRRLDDHLANIATF